MSSPMSIEAFSESELAIATLSPPSANKRTSKPSLPSESIHLCPSRPLILRYTTLFNLRSMLFLIIKTTARAIKRGKKAPEVVVLINYYSEKHSPQAGNKNKKCVKFL